MKLYLLVLFFISNAAFSFAWKWKDCGGNDRIIVYERIDISPLPVAIQSKDPQTISVKIRTKQLLDNDVTVSLRIYRQVSLYFTFRIPVPCIGSIGSCDYKFCQFAEKFNETVCPVIRAMGKDCHCPLEADDYIATDIPIHLVNVPIPPIIAKIGTGIYNVQALTTSSLGEELGCLSLEVEVDMKAK